MVTLKNVNLKFKGWNIGAVNSKWGKMQFEVVGTTLRDVTTPMLSIYQLNGKSIIDIECFILNNIHESTLLESSLESIIYSVLSVINDEDIQVVGGERFNVNNNFVVNNDDVSSDFIDDDYIEYDEYDDEYDDEYSDGDLSVDVSIQDVNGLDYYDDMGYDYDEDDEYDDDDDF